MMCGLAFLLAPDIAQPKREALVAAAVDRLNHRGPDERAAVHGNGWSMGHTRLAIIAPQGGHQPLRDPSKRWALAFNGEIYNYRQLRAALTDRWDFRDDSDTEVLLAGLLVEGARFVSRLEGMWAFVLFDSLEGDLLLSRDRFGKKPLYFHSQGRRFACASELPALSALTPASEPAEDAAGVSDYFRYGFALPGTTCVQGVREVLPAHVLRVDAAGACSSHRYWEPSTAPWTGSFREAASEVGDLFAAAVKNRQLAADVEVGAFLSGGVDSTAVCAIAQQAGFGRLRTFTAGFAEPSYDERAPAARAAGELGTLHSAQLLSPELAQDFARTLAPRLGQPFADASLIPTAMVSSLASRDVKVVLTGDGGDEVFGGYARHAGALLLQHYRKLPGPLRTLGERLVTAFREPAAHHSGSLLKRAHLFVGLAREPQRSYVAPPAMRSEILARIAPDLAAGHAPPDRPWPDDPDELRHMMLMDWLVWLPQDILQKVDRATMAFSLEARSPFLDRELVEFVLRLPWHWHFRGFRGKRLLRAALDGRVPDFVWKRRKQGFASPVAHWMRAAIGDELETYLREGDTGAINPKGALDILAEHRQGRRDLSQPLWLAYMYLGWRRSRGAAT